MVLLQLLSVSQGVVVVVVVVVVVFWASYEGGASKVRSVTDVDHRQRFYYNIPELLFRFLTSIWVIT